MAYWLNLPTDLLQVVGEPKESWKACLGYIFFLLGKEVVIDDEEKQIFHIVGGNEGDLRTLAKKKIKVIRVEEKEKKEAS